MTEPGVYLEKLSAFARILRMEGLPVSPRDTEDGAAILTQLGFADRETVKTALMTIYAKSREEQLKFSAAFDGFFLSEEAVRAQARERAEAMELAKRMKAMTLTVYAKGGGAGRLFGSVTSQEIADALQSQGITLDKRKIVIDEPIKNVGTYTIRCKLGYEITAPLTVKIEEG